ncbi:uncharacterized protein LOC129601237 [Paramacrobiotus metropolitanus]|uniref:uncharacterized protein LOC129601237 n=1 Tax=Paramacrobiotus metropolitanus TaxID=2943436 RepID=UPI0024458888|nr:uncharacterized protein LOC129601237 [Paramacrobiotus metropolitanus]
MASVDNGEQQSETPTELDPPQTVDLTQHGTVTGPESSDDTGLSAAVDTGEDLPESSEVSTTTLKDVDPGRTIGHHQLDSEVVVEDKDDDDEADGGDDGGNEVFDDDEEDKESKGKKDTTDNEENGDADLASFESEGSSDDDDEDYHPSRAPKGKGKKAASAFISDLELERASSADPDVIILDDDADDPSTARHRVMLQDLGRCLQDSNAQPFTEVHPPTRVKRTECVEILEHTAIKVAASIQLNNNLLVKY